MIVAGQAWDPKDGLAIPCLFVGWETLGHLVDLMAVPVEKGISEAGISTNVPTAGNKRRNQSGSVMGGLGGLRGKLGGPSLPDSRVQARVHHKRPPGQVIGLKPRPRDANPGDKSTLIELRNY